VRTLLLLGLLGSCLLAPVAVWATVEKIDTGASLTVLEPQGSSLNAAEETPEAEGDTGEAMEVYTENHAVQDFEVHFLISLPFTGLYSYLAISVLDGLVQGTFPPSFRQADGWVLIGLAVGGSLAVALGSTGRVPDQSQMKVPAAAPETENPTPGRNGMTRITLLQARF
jgi:hypothetical protein